MFQMVTNADNWVGEKDGNDMTLNIISGTLQTGKRLRLAGTDTANGTVNVSGGRLEVGRDELILGTTSVTGPDPLLSMTGGALAVRGFMLLRSGTFEIQGSNVSEISSGYGGADGGVTVEASGTIKAMVDAGGVTPIVVNDQTGDGVAGAVTFNAGSELDVGFLGIPDTVGTWTILERQGGPITDNGLALSSAAITAGWNLQIDNFGVNGIVKVSFGIASSEPEVFWDGGVSNDWDEATLNWFDAGGASTVACVDNSPVTFDNLRSNDGAVNPAEITVEIKNDIGNPTFDGPGDITTDDIYKTGTGTRRIFKRGGVTLTLSGTQTGGIPNDVDFSGTVSGNLNLIKSGLANVQTLSGVVSHTGDTTINAGILEISNAASDLNDASVVTITDGILRLPNGVTDTVNELWLDGGQVEAGTYGATGSGAANIDDVHFAGTGVLDVTTGDPVVDDYATWAAIYSPADLSDMAGDNDNDGLDNQTEYAFGLSPVSGSSVNPYISTDLSGGTFTYQRRSTTGLTYTIETSTDLAIWTPDATATQVGTPDGDNESVLVTPTGPLPPTKLFVRVKAD